MQTCRILVYLAVWKRPHITELCFAGLERLRAHPDFQVDVLAVISDESMIPLCSKYKVNWTMAPNEPLGRKKNQGLQIAKNFEFDYLMEIGSDDLILNELLDSYKPLIEAKALFFGIKDAAYINSEGGQCRRLISKSTYGAGRMIHRSVLEKAKWTLWHDRLNRGLDNDSVFAMQRMKVPYKRVEPSAIPHVIDVKSKQNIWKFDYFIGEEFDKKLIYQRLSAKEVEMLESW